MMEKLESNTKKTAFITGATGVIGKAIAQGIASNHGYQVVLVCRNEGKSNKAVLDIRRLTGNDNVSYEIVDLSRKSSIKAFAARWQDYLHVLVNNAGTTPPRRMETPEGIELQFATNVLGYFWMTQAFLEHLKQSAPARVINVASYWAGDLDINDLEFKRRQYNNNKAYRQSKAANRMLTVAFANRLKTYRISVNACHPGDVNSTLSNNLGFGGHETPEAGARTPVWLSIDPIGQNTTGKYFEHMRVAHCRFGEGIQGVEALYNVCSQY
jgi:retinol dehydrogenase-13